jgi:hypothetical protein
MVRVAGLLAVPAGTVITTGDHFGGAVAGITDAGFNAAHVAVDPGAVAPQKKPHIGSVVPSGSVVVVGAAVRLICWPNAATAAKRKSRLATAAAFNVALHVKSLIRIMVLASRCPLILNTNLGRHPPAGVRKLMAQTDDLPKQATGLPLLRFVDDKFP